MRPRALACRNSLTRAVIDRCSRRLGVPFARVGEPVGTDVEAGSHSTSKTSVSEMLASSLHRLGHSEIASSFIERAVMLAHVTGDEDLTGAGAYMAGTAISAGHYDAALVALAHANALAGEPHFADGSQSIRSA